MKPKHQRLTFIAIALLMLAAATAMILSAFEDNLVFFFSPSDIIVKPPEVGESIRVGGLVKEGSVEHLDDGKLIKFIVTDFANELSITYDDDLPSLFREGQGVVAEGSLAVDGAFTASRVLAKHDENYMPPEVAKSLKDAGHWEGKPEGEDQKPITKNLKPTK